MISFCFITNRKEPLVGWFIDSLRRQHRKEIPIQVIFVDFWKGLSQERDNQFKVDFCEHIHIKPLPSYCQGEHKVTQKDWFSATIARNTGIVYAIHPFIQFVDDLAVLSSGFFEAVVEAAKGRYVMQGAYRKDLKMEVENGILKTSHHNPHGQDARMRYARGVKGAGRPEWSYGNIGLPLELALKVNGYSELCSICGYEDCDFGMRLSKAGAQFIYDQRALAIESEENHHTEGNYFARQDPETSKERYEQVFRDFGAEPVHPHNGRYDASHVIVGLPRVKSEFGAYWNNYFLRDLRKKREAGEQITVEDMKFPQNWWFTGQPLTEL